MEIFIGIVVVLAILLIAGTIDNNRPVSTWSNEKLQRMYGKLVHAANMHNQSGHYDSATKHFEKSQEVLQEIKKRESAFVNELSSKTISEISVGEFNDLAKIFAERSVQLIQKTMKENSCSESDAMEIISSKINELEIKYRQEGYSEDDASEKAMQKLLSI